MAPLRLQHLHFPSHNPSHFPPYSLASKLQSLLRRQHLDHKDSPSGPPPPPALISFTPLPIYTLGRRQSSPLSQSEIARLSQPLSLAGGTTTLPVTTSHSPRGGLTTYHGPGQIVLWPVLDIHSRSHKQFTVRCYSRLLENTTISTLRSLFRIEAFTTEDPGVWTAVEGKEERKIAALGVHLRRHISGLGTAINVDMPSTADVTDEKANPWKRIVACGIEGKTVTCVRERLPADQVLRGTEEVADGWAGELARRIEVDGGVEKMGVERVLRLLEEAIDKSEEGEEQGEREYINDVWKGVKIGWVEEALNRGV
ncbi:putative lipoate-protein ligase [Triangularia verruculosa]|uniref:lipoyl(octanoyl) transferase n=1 Tax=Triangularia verruculosa TaxID=2587418 RepID=A0AAN6XFS1_9PEZI|nr:putative lipoate-protein ligase [Triangularia verruculosa]